MLLRPNCNITRAVIAVRCCVNNTGCKVKDERILTKSDESVASLQDISRLPTKFRNKMSHVDKINPREFPHQFTLRHERFYYGKHGKRSGIDPRLLWPSREELDTLIEEEDLYEPSLEERIETIELRKQAEAESLEERKSTILKSMADMPKIIEQFEKKEETRMRETKKAQEKRKQLLEEAKEFYGRRVDVNSSEFKEMVAKKNELEKKAEKERLKKERQAKLAAALGHAASKTAAKS